MVCVGASGNGRCGERGQCAVQGEVELGWGEAEMNGEKELCEMGEMLCVW